MSDVYTQMEAAIEEALALLSELPQPVEPEPARPVLTVIKGGKTDVE